MATKAKTARKKAVKPVRMWAISFDNEISSIEYYQYQAKARRIKGLASCMAHRWKVIPVLVTPAHKGKP